VTKDAVTKDAVTFLAGACPIVGSYGARGWTLGGAADRLERALTGTGSHRLRVSRSSGHPVAATQALTASAPGSPRSKAVAAV